MGGETHLKITRSSIMAKKKSKAKRKIVVQKRPRKKRKTKGKKRKVKGAVFVGSDIPLCPLSGLRVSSALTLSRVIKSLWLCNVSIYLYRYINDNGILFYQ